MELNITRKILWQQTKGNLNAILECFPSSRMNDYEKFEVIIERFINQVECEILN